MKMLKVIFLKLKQETNQLTHNPLLNCFDQDDLERIDHKANSDSFIAEKKRNILNYIKNTNIDFDPQLIRAYDEYSEAMTYFLLTEKFDKVRRVPESKSKTPDFEIEFECNDSGKTEVCSVYAELKSLSFADGNLNYKKTMEQGLNAQIDLERQLNQGRKVATAFTEIQPLLKKNKNYDPTSIKYLIEVLIEKIEQNIKEGQFSLGDTILLIDLKQLGSLSPYMESATPVFQEKMYQSLVSGIQWNIAFGKVGQLVFKPIEFEGRDNIEGELGREGILVKRNFIKAIIFINYCYSDSGPKIVGLHQQRNIGNSVEAFLHRFCDFVNDERNSNGWRINEPH